MAGEAGSDRASGWMRSCVLCAVLVATLTARTGALAGEDTPRRRDPPKEWDEELVPLVDAAENLRDLHFEHPVPVKFLGDRAFEKELEADSTPTKKERDELEYTAGTLRALGLFHGDADDLLEAVIQLGAAGTLAFYDPEAERIVIRGRELDVETEVTVVHELVHALQDQHFDLDALLDQAESSGTANAVAALVEGDAGRVETEYIFGLRPAERDELFAAGDRTARELEEDIPADTPEILPVLFSFPYELGPFFVTSLLADGGSDRVDDAFREPPLAEESVLVPSTYLDGDKPEKVRQVELEPGEEKVGEREPLGAFGWYLLLAARIDPATALGAAEGWGGDEIVHFQRGGKACARIGYRGEDDDDTERMAAAIDQWIATLPAGVADVERGSQLTLTACDPGAGAAHEADALLDAAALLGSRALIGSILQQQGGVFDAEVVQCAALALALDPAYVEWLAGDTTDEEDVPFFEQTDAALAACEA